MMPAPSTAERSRNRSAYLFLGFAGWVLVSLWLAPLLSFGLPWLQQALSVLLLFSGFYLGSRRWITNLRPMSSVGFVRRPSAMSEFGLGAAIGWAIALGLVLPLLLLRRASLSFDFSTAAWHDMGWSFVTLSLGACAAQLIFTGVAFRLLVESIGATAATLALMLLTGLMFSHEQPGQPLASFTLMLASLLGSVGWLRTRALWLPLGLHLGWTLILSLLFGMPSANGVAGAGVVRGEVSGPVWLTGGDLGPEASLLGVVVLLLAVIVLVRSTRDYAWHYTYQPIVGAGYPMEVAPPAVHQQMEAQAAATPPRLVQIQPQPSAPDQGSPPGVDTSQ